MRESEMWKLLAMSATVDSREVTPERVAGWMASIGHLDFDACVSALWEFHGSSTDFLKPGHIAALVGAAAERTVGSLDAERAALEGFVSYTGLERGVVAAHWGDAPWLAEHLAVARETHYVAAIEGSGA